MSSCSLKSLSLIPTEIIVQLTMITVNFGLRNWYPIADGKIDLTELFWPREKWHRLGVRLVESVLVPPSIQCWLLVTMRFSTHFSGILGLPTLHCCRSPFRSVFLQLFFFIRLKWKWVSYTLFLYPSGNSFTWDLNF